MALPALQLPPAPMHTGLSFQYHQHWEQAHKRASTEEMSEERRDWVNGGLTVEMNWGIQTTVV